VKRVGIGLACLVIGGVSVKAQFLGGIFSQGSTELKNSTTQLALLEALSGSTDEGYAIFEAGLTNTATINGAEYGLHQMYFASLAAVNPAVSGMPEVADIINLAGWIGDGFSPAVDRWQNSGRLTAAELGYVGQVATNSCQTAVSMLGQLKELLTADESSMTDADRVRRVVMLDRAAREEYGFMLDFIAGGDRLVAERQMALR
jgi:hypothetical protein